jgi:hypothetical protein
MGGVSVEDLFQYAYIWGLGATPINNVLLAVKNFLAYSKDEGSDYQVPSGVVELARIVINCERPQKFFPKKETVE